MSLDKACKVMCFFQGLQLTKSQADSLLNQLARRWENDFDLLCMPVLEKVEALLLQAMNSTKDAVAARRHDRPRNSIHCLSYVLARAQPKFWSFTTELPAKTRRTKIHFRT